MAIAFPNRARSYDENARRIRFLGHDGMFEIRFSLDIDVLTLSLIHISEPTRPY